MAVALSQAWRGECGDRITSAFNGDHPGRHCLRSHVRAMPSTLHRAALPPPSVHARLCCAGTRRSSAGREPFPIVLPSPRARRYSRSERYAHRCCWRGGRGVASAGVSRRRRRWRSTAGCSPRRWWVARWRGIPPSRRPGVRERRPADGRCGSARFPGTVAPRAGRSWAAGGAARQRRRVASARSAGGGVALWGWWESRGRRPRVHERRAASGQLRRRTLLSPASTVLYV